MKDIRLSDIITYPVKSTKGIHLSESIVTPRGLQYDRHWALVGADGVVITARKYPQLLAVSPQIIDNQLELVLPGQPVVHMPLPEAGEKSLPVQVFSGHTRGLAVSKALDAWFSDYLQTSCRLVFMGPENHREVLSKHGGKQGDVVSFADQCPLLLLSEASLADLNARLEAPITMAHFRPNLVISGCAAYEEETWKSIRIGDCVFEVSQACIRCVFTTINPITRQKHPQQEPLRTLATYKQDPRGGVRFGMHLIPRTTGTIRVGEMLHIEGYM